MDRGQNGDPFAAELFQDLDDAEGDKAVGETRSGARSDATGRRV